MSLLDMSNQRGRFRTWHFTSEIAPDHQIRADIDYIATSNSDATYLHISLVKVYIRDKVLTQAKPHSVKFISWRFSRADAALWVSNARASIPLSTLPFEGYIQADDALDVPRLHRWMPDAIWQNVSGKLHRSTAYQQFSDAAANDAFEYGNAGSLALSKGGRPRKAISVSTYQTMRTMIFYNLNPN